MMPVQVYNTTDKLIRDVLLKDLKNKYKDYDQNNTAIISELALPSGIARIDVAVVNGVMHGYELKSDFDNLLRLRLQIDAYNLIFDKVTLVVGRKHILEAMNLIPSWWGITVAKTNNGSDNLSLFSIKDADDNPKQDIFTLSMLLWKSEAYELLRRKDLKVKKNLSKEIVCNKLQDYYEKSELKSEIRKALVKRFFNSSWKVDGALGPCGD